MGEDQPVTPLNTVDVAMDDVNHVVQHVLTCPAMQGERDDMSRVMTLYIAAHALGAYFFGRQFTDLAASGQLHVEDAVRDRVEAWTKTAAEMRGKMI